MWKEQLICPPAFELLFSFRYLLECWVIRESNLTLFSKRKDHVLELCDINNKTGNFPPLLID